LAQVGSAGSSGTSFACIVAHEAFSGVAHHGLQ